MCAFLAAAPASARTGQQITPPRPPDPKLFVVGDSVSLGAQGAINARLSYHGWHVTQVSRESLHTWEANGIVDANRAAIGEVVVVQLGTNDGMDPGLFAQWLDGLMGRLIDVRRVYWINLRNFAPWVPAANQVIAEAATRWRNLRVIDWNAAASPDPSLVHGDGYHLNPAGQEAMAHLLAVTLDAYVVERVTPATTAPPTTTPQAPESAAPTTRAARSTAQAEDDLPVLTLALAGAVTLVICGIAIAWSRRGTVSQLR
jgi:lysophospholipase L1-like esterase